MLREEYFRRKFQDLGTPLGRRRAEPALSVKFRDAFFCQCDACGWQPALAEFRTAADEFQRRGLAISTEPHETGIEIIVYGAMGSLLSTGVIGLAKLILTRWNRPRQSPSYRDIQIEVRRFRTDGRFTEERIVLVRYPAQEQEIEKALEILEAFLTHERELEDDKESPSE